MSRRPIVLIAICLLAFGCGSSERFVGKWQGERDVRAQPGADPYIVKTLSRIRITITDKGTFEMQDAGMPKTGTVRVGSKDGKTVAFLKIDAIMDRPLAEQPRTTQDRNSQEIELTLQPDGTATYVDPQGFEEKPVVMKRESQPDPPNVRK